MNSVYQHLLNDLNLKYGDTVVVAVSGGPDSMALLNLLIKLKKALNINVICAHVNHGVRQESHDEEEFVKSFCANNNVVFEVMKIENYSDENFHHEARDKRYSFFKDIVNKYNAKYLMTAHHGDDLIETILMRISRGSTIRGYSGFGDNIKMGNYSIIRPLINNTKEEIIKYCRLNKIKYVKDSSNDKNVYTRNRFRKKILPFLKKEDANIHQKFYKFSKLLQMYDDYIDKEVDKKMKIICNQNSIDIEKYFAEEDIIQNKILQKLLESIYQNDITVINDRHIELINKLMKSSKPNCEIYMPQNVRGIKSYNNFKILKDKKKIETYKTEFNKYINLPNGNNITQVEKSALTNNNICRLNSKEIIFPLFVQSRTDGQRIYIKGMKGSKKINDIFTDEKIDKEARDLWPILVDSNNNVLWLPGLKKTKFDKSINENYDIILEYH